MGREKRFLRTFLDRLRLEFEYILHRPRRVLFDHLPKCGGTTITEYLALHYPKRRIFQTDSWRPLESVREFMSLPSRKRYSFSLIMGHNAHALCEFVHPETIAVTVFREPVDRLVSHFYYVCRTPQHRLHRTVVENKMSLDQYVRSGISPELRNWYVVHFTGLPVEEAEANPEKALQMAMAILTRRYAMIGFQDNLTPFISRLAQVARLHKPFLNPVRNRTPDRPELADIPVKVREAIEEVNFLDVKLYRELRAKFSGTEI